MYVGLGLGSLLPLFLMDRIGRKGTLIVGTVPKVASWLLIGFAGDTGLLLLGRCLAGIGCGVTYAVMPMYLGEISSTRSRGPLGTLLAVLLNIGMLLIYVLGLILDRFQVAMMAVCLPIVFLLSFIWLPETSVFLTKKNRLRSAERTLKWSLAKEDVGAELEEVKRIVATEERAEKMTLIGGLREMCMSRRNRRAFAISTILLSAMSLTGAAPILAFQSYIFDEAGFRISTNASIILTGCAIVLGGSFCVGLLPKTGRKLLLLISAPSCFLSLLVLAIFFNFKNSGYDLENFTWLPTVFLVGYVFSYGLGLNPIPLAYIGEIFPVDVKVPAAIYSALYYAITTAANVEFYQMAQKNFGTHAPLWVYTIITFILWILLYLFVPETEGKTLEEIQLEL
ncbi:facilitated trehalose transporter Tret1-like isoform X2 [Prorops nasuta]